MRKFIVLCAAMVVGGWVMSGTTAKAELGCLCMGVKPMTCTSGVSSCMASGGVCVFGCDYSTMTPAKAAKSKRMSKKKS